jgi:hypothetical protein
LQASDALIARLPDRAATPAARCPAGSPDEEETMEIAETVGRVERHTPGEVNERIHRDIECSLSHHAAHPEAIDQRLDELNREWDIERTLEAQASGMVLTGLVLSVVRGRKWLGLAAVSGYFLMQHALKGWCPPVSLYRRLGVRTANEIELERTALKAIRGDFGNLGESRDPQARAEAALNAATKGISYGRACCGLGDEGITILEETETIVTISDPGRRAAGAPRTRPESRGGGPGLPGFADGGV